MADKYHILIKHRLINTLQLYLLFSLLSGLVAYVALLIGGPLLAALSFGVVVLLYIFNPYIGTAFILKMYKAELIPYSSAPALYDLLDIIADRAELKKTPNLFYIRSSVLNSFSIGQRENAVIALSDGLLQQLSYEELAGVISHEISHIKNNDIQVMTFADLAGRIIKILSLMGQLFILLSLPLAILANVEINFLPLLIIAFAPVASDLIQLGLSRLREYEADYTSAMLLGDARPLAAALKKIDFYEHHYFRNAFSPFVKIQEPSILRTHPQTEERIKRLLEIQHAIEYTPHAHEQVQHNSDYLSGKKNHHSIKTKHTKPRRHSNGFWY